MADAETVMVNLILMVKRLKRRMLRLKYSPKVFLMLRVLLYGCEIYTQLLRGELMSLVITVFSKSWSIAGMTVKLVITP